MPPPQALDAFIAYLTEIAPDHKQPITPESHLIDDLNFDAIAFSCLGLLMYERYGIGGVTPETLRSENLTVEEFFLKCIHPIPGHVSPNE
jgi:hypothetical protein